MIYRIWFDKERPYTKYLRVEEWTNIT